MNRINFSPNSTGKSPLDLSPLISNGFRAGKAKTILLGLKHAGDHHQNQTSLTPKQQAKKSTLMNSHSRSSSFGLSTTLSTGGGNIQISSSSNTIYAQYHHILNSPKALLSPRSSTSAKFLSQVVKAVKPIRTISKDNIPKNKFKVVPQALKHSPSAKSIVAGDISAMGSTVQYSRNQFYDREGSGVFGGKPRSSSAKRVNYNTIFGYPFLKEKTNSTERIYKPNERLETVGESSREKHQADINSGSDITLKNHSSDSFAKTGFRHTRIYKSKLKNTSSKNDQQNDDSNRSKDIDINQLSLSERSPDVLHQHFKGNARDLDKLLERYYKRVSVIQTLSKASIQTRKDMILQAKKKETENQKIMEAEVKELKEKLNVQVPEKFEKYKNLLSGFITNHLSDYEKLNKIYKRENEKYLGEDPDDPKTQLRKSLKVFNIACKRKYMNILGKNKKI
jgi:hypothetical protein